MKKIIKLTESDLVKLVKRVIQEEDNVSLRKLTLKSKWDFTPKHTGWTIAEVLKFNPKSILWAYTHLQKITFMDDILDELQKKYPDLERIEKPGIDKEQYDFLVDKSNPWLKFSYDELKNIIAAKKINKQKIHKLLYDVYYQKKDEHKIDKAKAKDPFQNVDRKEKMQRRNQGKSTS